MAHLACTCAAWPTAPCCRAPVCHAQPLALPHCRCTRQGPRQRLKRRLLRGLHRYRLSRLRWRRRPSPRTRLGRLRSGADRTVHPRSTRQPSRRPCLASAQRHPVDPDAGSTLQLGLGAAGLNMPYARSPTSCCSPSPAVLCSHATPVPPVHATSPSRLRQPKLQRRVVEAAYGAGWAEVSATIAGATPWRQATSCPRHHPCAPLTPPPALPAVTKVKHATSTTRTATQEEKTMMEIAMEIAIHIGQNALQNKQNQITPADAESLAQG